MKLTRASTAFGSAALAVCVALLTSCRPTPATEIMLRIDSNMGPELHSVRVVFDRGAGTPVLGGDAGGDYMIGPRFRLPGTIGVVPSNPNDMRPLRAQVTANPDTATSFTVTVSLAFVPQRTLELDVFLAAECENEAVRNACTGMTTCGRGGQCVPIAQPTRDFQPDAAAPDAPAPDIAMDSTIDATDAPGEIVSMDVPIDAPADVAADIVDVPVDVPTDLPAPRQVAPLSTSTVSRETPTLHWVAAMGGSAMTHVQLSTTRDFAAIAHDYTASGTMFTVSDALATGVWFWRLASDCGGTACVPKSAVWQFRVLHPHGATIDNSFGVSLDVNGDGRDDLAIGSPRHLNMATGGTGSVWLYQDVTAAPTLLLGAPSAGMSFGDNVAAAGDVNGDGFGELVVADTSVGVVHVYQGSSAGLPAAANQRIMAPSGSMGFGAAIAGIGDVDGDGYGDVVIGAPGSNQAFVYKGSAGGLRVTPQTLTGPAPGGFGTAVAGGDMNGDGLADVAIGAPTALGYGVVYAFPADRASGAIDTASRIEVVPGMNVDAFGTSLASGGDVNGDGLADLVVGAPGSMGGAGRGEVYVGTAGVLGTAPTYILGYGTSIYIGAGRTAAMGGDVDDDGHADFVLGGPTYAQAFQTGYVIVAHACSGGSCTRTGPMFPPGMMLDHAWGTAVALGYFDNDTIADVAATDPRSTSGQYGAAVWIGVSGGMLSTMPILLDVGFTDLFGQSLAIAEPAGRGGLRLARRSSVSTSFAFAPRRLARNL